MDRCFLCGNAGWVLDAKIDDEPTTLELLPCFAPECPVSGRDVAVLCLFGKWGDPVFQPNAGTAVMSLRRVDRWPTT